MRVTIVPEDRYIQVDGRGLNFDFAADPNIHAIQWYGDHGTVEQKIGGSRPATLAEVQPFIDAWEAERVIVDNPPPPPEPTLSELKAKKNLYINASRGFANEQTFSHAGKTFSCDRLSRSDIDGVNGFVTLTGALPPGFPGAWKAVDNTYHPIANVAAWAAFYGAMVATGAAHFAHSESLKAALAAATTAEAVAAIVW